MSSALSFDDGWVVADVKLVNMPVLLASDGIPAWLATIERT